MRRTVGLSSTAELCGSREVYAPPKLVVCTNIFCNALPSSAQQIADRAFTRKFSKEVNEDDSHPQRGVWGAERMTFLGLGKNAFRSRADVGAVHPADSLDFQPACPQMLLSRFLSQLRLRSRYASFLTALSSPNGTEDRTEAPAITGSHGAVLEPASRATRLRRIAPAASAHHS